MSDRRPTQRPAGSAPRRPAPARPGTSTGRPAPRPANGRRPPARRRRRASGRFFVVLAVFVLIIVILAVVLLLLKPSDAPQTGQPVSAQQSMAPAQQDATATQPEQVSGSALSDMLADEDSALAGLTSDQQVDVTDLSINPDLAPEWKNVLLLGTDQRAQGVTSRSDTMIICSINTQTGEVKLASFMRDIAVDLSGIGDYERYNPYRLNAANYFGGPDLAMKTINELCDLNIEDYVMVNFNGFAQVAEALGGVTMDITQTEMEAINYYVYTQAMIAQKYGWDESSLPDPTQELTQYGEDVHLNGRQTLAYARIRKIDSDWERTNRQRKVLVALMEQLEGANAMQLMQTGLTLLQYLETNLTIDEIVSIAVTVLNSNLENVETMTIPVEGSYVQETRNNQSMFYDVDWATNTRQLHNFIYY